MLCYFRLLWVLNFLIHLLLLLLVGQFKCPTTEWELMEVYPVHKWRQSLFVWIWNCSQSGNAFFFLSFFFFLQEKLWEKQGGFFWCLPFFCPFFTHPAFMFWILKKPTKQKKPTQTNQILIYFFWCKAKVMAFYFLVNSLHYYQILWDCDENSGGFLCVFCCFAFFGGFVGIFLG